MTRTSPLFGFTGIGALVGCLLLHPLGKASAQAPARSGDTTAGSPRGAIVSASSPRAMLEDFLRLARLGRYADAARYLDVPDSAVADAPTLARHLKAVLDRSLWIDLEEVSGAASGDTADGLPPAIESLGAIVDAGGLRAPVRLSRSDWSEEGAWRFSQATVQRIPAWYSHLPDRWMHEHLPAMLLRPGPLDLLWWQWAAIPVLLVVAGVLGWLLSRVLRSSIARLTSRTRTTWDDAVLDRLASPLTAALTLGTIAALIPLLSLYRPAADAVLRAVRVAGFVVVFWSLWRLIDVGRLLLAHTAWARASASSRALLPLAGRIAKVAVLAIAAVAVLSLLGYPVASLVAGLGIGGLALALAAQKTVENLFGAFSIGVDQPFREGDFVKIEEFVGTVEAIGLRSTRFRTLDRTIITIPNGKLAEMRLESFAVRDRLRLATIVGLVYETTAEQMRAVLDGFEGVLRAHPKIWPDAVVVRFSALGASSLDIEVMAWFETSDWGEFQRIRQEILLQFIEVVEEAGTAFAFPTQTLHISSVPRYALDS